MSLCRAVFLKGTSGTDGRPLSFTAFLIASFARAIHAHPAVQAYRDFRNRLITFHDVDISTVVEPRPGLNPYLSLFDLRTRAL